MNERALIQRAAAGDPAAERAIYDQHVGKVYRMAYRMTGDEALAEDFTQEIFVRAFDRLDRFEFRSRLSTWLHSITTSVVLNGLRKRRRTEQHEFGHEALELVSAAAPDLDHSLKLTLHQAIDQLGEDMRMTFVLHDLEGYTHAEIAKSMDVEEGTSKARLSRARAKLRVALAENTIEDTHPDNRAPRSGEAGS